MVAAVPEARVEEIAHDLFEVVTQVGLAVPRGRRRAGDLKEVEFLTLAILHEHGTMIVGDIQRLLGVLPAQMSRVIRSLETRTSPTIACHINPQDKRKVNVRLTPAGERALQDYQAARVRRFVDLLQHLSEDGQEELSRILGKLRDLFGHRPEE